MPDEIDHPHDRLFRAVFSDAAEAASLLQAAVPRKLRENVDWNSLRLVEGTFVDDALRQSESDLLFEAGYGKETEGHGKVKDRLRLYLLFERRRWFPLARWTIFGQSRSICSRCRTKRQRLPSMKRCGAIKAKEEGSCHTLNFWRKAGQKAGQRARKKAVKKACSAAR